MTEKPEHAERPLNGGTQQEQPLTRFASHKHVEAFRLMLYSSEDGSEIETVWNSRDGVAPFTIVSRDNAKQMRHVLWGGDPYAPHHVPNIGDRIFVDLSAKDAEELARRTVDRFWDDPADPWRMQFGSKEEAYRNVRSEMSKPGAPTMCTVNVSLQQAFLQLRSELAQKLQRRILDQRQGIGGPGVPDAAVPR